jgi:hypothetical protein
MNVTNFVRKQWARLSGKDGWEKEQDVLMQDGLGGVVELLLPSAIHHLIPNSEGILPLLVGKAKLRIALDDPTIINGGKLIIAVQSIPGQIFHVVICCAKELVPRSGANLISRKVIGGHPVIEIDNVPSIVSCVLDVTDTIGTPLCTWLTIKYSFRIVKFLINLFSLIRQMEKEKGKDQPHYMDKTSQNEGPSKDTYFEG